MAAATHSGRQWPALPKPAGARAHHAATPQQVHVQRLEVASRRVHALPASSLHSSVRAVKAEAPAQPRASHLPLLTHRSPSTAHHTWAVRTGPVATRHPAGTRHPAYTKQAAASTRAANPGSYGTPQGPYVSPQPPHSDKFSSAGAADQAYTYAEESPEEAARRAQASKRVDRTSRYFRRLGTLGFWGQLVCSLVAAVILAFSVIISGTPSAPISTYLTFTGILAAFASVFWSFGYLRMADRLKAAVDNPMKAPPRAAVVANLKNGLLINLLGMGATLLGLQSTVGVLVAKALTSSTPMYGAAGTPPGFNPVLALDVFLVQASGNTALSHFLGMVLTLELLRSTTQSQPPPESMHPKTA